MKYSLEIITSLKSRDGQQIVLTEIPFNESSDEDAKSHITSEEFNSLLKKTLSQLDGSLYNDNLLLSLRAANRTIQTIITSFSEILD